MKYLGLCHVSTIKHGIQKEKKKFLIDKQHKDKGATNEDKR